MFHSTLGLLIMLVSCNPNGVFNGGPSSERSSFATEKPKDPPPKAPVAVTPEENKASSGDATAIGAADFAKLCASGVKKSRLVVLDIPANTGSKCPYGQGDNLGMMEGKIAARIEKDFPLDIPKSHKICSMKVEATKQLMRYDDHLFLTLNKNVVLASTTEVSLFADGANGFKQYDWSKIRGAGSLVSMSYCGPGILCALPRTEVEGDFVFSISDAASPKIFAPLVDSDLKFGLILTGDNNPDTDCQLNTSLKFSVVYEYVE